MVCPVFPGPSDAFMHAIINLNKPLHITSHKAVSKVKRLCGAKKAGHAGTLDPEATGVLLVCLNEATKIVRFLTDMDKEYVARIKLGERTDTFDSAGRILESRDISSLSEGDLCEAVRTFQGVIRQKSPMYSAVKIGGQKLYTLARKGLEIERPDRTVTVFEISIESIDFPFAELKISCSKGTYIRSLCDDLGRKLGVGAHLTGLERTAVGPFHIRDSFSFDDLTVDETRFCSIDQALERLPEIVLNDADYRKAKNGVTVVPELPTLGKGEFVRLKGPEGILFAIGRLESKRITIERILNLE